MDRSQGRIARPAGDAGATTETFTGNRGLQLEEKLIFEQLGQWGFVVEAIVRTPLGIHRLRNRGSRL